MLICGVTGGWARDRIGGRLKFDGGQGEGDEARFVIESSSTRSTENQPAVESSSSHWVSANSEVFSDPEPGDAHWCRPAPPASVRPAASQSVNRSVVRQSQSRRRSFSEKYILHYPPPPPLLGSRRIEGLLQDLRLGLASKVCCGNDLGLNEVEEFIARTLAGRILGWRAQGMIQTVVAGNDRTRPWEASIWPVVVDR